MRMLVFVLGRGLTFTCPSLRTDNLLGDLPIADPGDDGQNFDMKIKNSRIFFIHNHTITLVPKTITYPDAPSAGPVVGNTLHVYVPAIPKADSAVLNCTMLFPGAAKQSIRFSKPSTTPQSTAPP